jgi:uncharacterized protein YebE (UPF0316 family)
MYVMTAQRVCPQYLSSSSAICHKIRLAGYGKSENCADGYHGLSLPLQILTRSKGARKKIDLGFRCHAKILDVRTCNMWKKCCLIGGV